MARAWFAVRMLPPTRLSKKIKQRQVERRAGGLKGGLQGGLQCLKAGDGFCEIDIFHFAQQLARGNVLVCDAVAAAFQLQNAFAS